ncbi:MAG: HRDC domain-containing protein [Bacteroidetes bacterium]|nr:HRDC domain-containing protein [Bacteroidota bacterium]
MQIRFFTIPITSVNDYNDELNTFLRSNKVVEIEKQLIQTPNGVYWCIYISYILTNIPEYATKERIDYMKVLEPEVFARFSKLREIRKKIAFDDSVSAYVVFTDAELAEMAKLPELTINKLKSIKGVGDKKTDKYGATIIKIFNAEMNETSGKPDPTDILF